MKQPEDINRREVLQTLGSASVAAAISGSLSAETRSGDMIYRTLGRTGERVSAIGLGGFHIGVPKDEAESARIIHSAIDRGMNFMDNCWDYHDGKSEIWMGNALRGGYRKKVFLMTKFDGRTKDSTARQIDESLKRLQTDVIDLMQYHENIRLEDPDRFFNDGPLEALLAAKKAGKIRYIGFTGHKDPAVHLRMLELAAQHKFHFDSAQMPLNLLDAHFRSFSMHVVPKLVEQGIGVLGMKPMASGAIPENKIATGLECLHFALNLKTSVVINGCPTMKDLDQAFEAAKTFRPMSETQVSALLAKTREAALTGRYEKFKTSQMFDGTATNPQWMA